MHLCSINSGYPAEYLETYTNRKYQLLDPLYEQFCKTFEIQNSNELKHFYKGTTLPVLRLNEEFGLSNNFLYGICCPNINPFIVFTIAGQQIKIDYHTKIIIKYLVPYLSIALKHLMPFPLKENVDSLTLCELDVLKWIKEGKSSWEISVILNKSERVVNFHIGNILKKLNAGNRTHAVAIALENNLIGA